MWENVTNIFCVITEGLRVNHCQSVCHPTLTSFHTAPNRLNKFVQQINPNTRWAWCNPSMCHSRGLITAMCLRLIKCEDDAEDVSIKMQTHPFSQCSSSLHISQPGRIDGSPLHCDLHGGLWLLLKHWLFTIQLHETCMQEACTLWGGWSVFVLFTTPFFPPPSFLCPAARP